MRLLLAVDGSAAAGRATEFVAGYRGEPSRVAPVVLNVQVPPIMLWPEAVLDARSAGEALRESGQRLADAASRRLAEAGLRAQQAVQVDFPANGIRRGAAHHALIRSIALKAVAASSVPVLLVK